MEDLGNVEGEYEGAEGVFDGEDGTEWRDYEEFGAGGEGERVAFVRLG